MLVLQDDPYNLQRFVDAQQPVYEQVCAELRRGNKTGHWMWFIFPQIQGLGSSETARYFAISCYEEAAAYLEHQLLGSRLKECTQLLTLIEGKSIDQILGHPDNLKFKSSMTLFANATRENEVFLTALKMYFGGESDPMTIARL